MLQIGWLIFCLTLFPQVGSSPSSAIELYEDAVQASEQGQTQAAMQYLQTIVRDYPRSRAALPAVLHLAENSMVGGQAGEAVDWLLGWSSQNGSCLLQIYDSSSQTQAPPDDQPSVVHSVESGDRFRKLLSTALTRLSNDQLNSLRSGFPILLDDNASPIQQNPTAQVVLREQFRRAMRSGQSEQAWQYLMEMGDSVTRQEREIREFHLPLAMLRQSPSSSQLVAIDDLLNQSQSLSQSQRISLKIASAEARQKLQDFTSAQDILTEMADELTVLSLDDTQSDSQSTAAIAADSAHLTHAELQQWRSIVDLKRAELLVLTSKTADAKVVLRAAIDRFPNSDIHHELIFLLVRCLIADIEFETALAELRVLIAENQLSREARAHGLWLTGEIELLRRELDSAMAHYDQVVGMSDQPRWVARSLVQLGRCMELKSRPSEALSCYHQVLSQHADSDVADVAAHRISQLRATSPDSNPNPTGNPGQIIQPTGRKAELEPSGQLH